MRWVRVPCVTWMSSLILRILWEMGALTLLYTVGFVLCSNPYTQKTLKQDLRESPQAALNTLVRPEG